MNSTKIKKDVINAAYSKEILAWYDRSSAIPLVCYTIISFVIYRLMGPPILILIVPFGIAYAYWFAFMRERPVAFTRRFMVLFLAMYSFQFFHLIEEWNTGFYQAFPALWGQLIFGNPGHFASWDMHVFITGNLVMDALWAIALGLFERKNAWANYTLYLFLSGMVVNAIQHPFYALYLGLNPNLQHYLLTAFGLNYHWYFPGLFTSFGHAILSTLMIRELVKQYKTVKEPIRQVATELMK
jgi:hypothetical protein